MEMVVLLPAPLGPRRLKISPSRDVEAHAVDGQHALGRVVLLAQLLDLDDAHRPTLLVRASDGSLYTTHRARSRLTACSQVAMRSLRVPTRGMRLRIGVTTWLHADQVSEAAAAAVKRLARALSLHGSGDPRAVIRLSRDRELARERSQRSRAAVRPASTSGRSELAQSLTTESPRQLRSDVVHRHVAASRAARTSDDAQAPARRRARRQA